MFATTRITFTIIKLRAPDSSLVAFPNDTLANCVQVFRNAIGSDDESRIAEDLSAVLDKEAETAYASASFEQGRVVRNRATDLHGYEPNLKIRDWHKMTDRIVKGIVWSPMLAVFCKDVAPIALKYDLEQMKKENLTHDQYMNSLVDELKAYQKDPEIRKKHEAKEAAQSSGISQSGLPLPSAPSKEDVMIPDTVKVVEHHLPGYEMHTEQPVVGSVFLMLNLMSSTVITFDDEASNRFGEVLLPERSLMRVSGEVRWGWRWGERFDREHVFSMTRRKVRPSMRTSVQIFKYAKHLVDQRKLQETVEAGAKRIAEADAEERTKKIKDEESKAAEKKSSEKKPVVESEEDKLKRRQKEKDGEEAFAHNVLKGQGALGGDLPTASAAVQRAAKLGTAPHQTGATMSDKMKRFHGYSQDLGRIGTMMQKLSGQQSDTSKPLADMSINDELNKMRSTASVTDDGFIYDMEHCNMTWQQMDDRSRVYKEKLQKMTYDALQDTTVEGADDDEESSTGGEGLLPQKGTGAAQAAPAKKKPFDPNPKHFTGDGVVVGSFSSSEKKPGIPSFEEAQEALVRAKAKGLTQADFACFGQDLEVEAFDPMKAAENISKNWIGKLKRPPGNSGVPPPPSEMQ